VAVVRGGDIWTSADYGSTWTNQTATSSAHGLWWQAVTSDASGNDLVAAVQFGPGGASGADLWRSVNAGASWTNLTAGTPATGQAWSCIASDSTGTHLVAGTYGSSFATPLYANLWESSDSGVTWTNQTGSTNYGAWAAVTSSVDGTRLAAAFAGDIWSYSSLLVGSPGATVQLVYLGGGVFYVLGATGTLSAG
jgi:hypothetical protein